MISRTPERKFGRFVEGAGNLVLGATALDLGAMVVKGTADMMGGQLISTPDRMTLVAMGGAAFAGAFVGFLTKAVGRSLR